MKACFHRNDGVDTRTEDVLTDWNSARPLQPGRIMRTSHDYKAVVVNTQQDESRIDQGDFGNRLAATLEDYEYEPHFSANDADDYAVTASCGWPSAKQPTFRSSPSRCAATAPASSASSTGTATATNSAAPSSPGNQKEG